MAVENLVTKLAKALHLEDADDATDVLRPFAKLLGSNQVILIALVDSSGNIIDPSTDAGEIAFDELLGALRVIDISPALDRTVGYQEIQAATTINAAETVLGGEVDVSKCNYITYWYDYVKGDESGVYLRAYTLPEPGGDEMSVNEKIRTGRRVWGTYETEAVEIYEDADKKSTWTIDVRGKQRIKIYHDADGGTPTGTLQIGYTVSNN